MDYLNFKATVICLNRKEIVCVPFHISSQLPSRGMIMVEGKLNDFNFIAPLEPDGKDSHWFFIKDAIPKETSVNVGDTVNLSIKVTGLWSSPVLTDDFKSSLISNDLLQAWNALTKKAQWEWFRWIRSASMSTTRQKRIETACSMLKKGKRRPCCFNYKQCTDPSVSKGGILLNLDN